MVVVKRIGLVLESATRATPIVNPNRLGDSTSSDRKVWLTEVPCGSRQGHANGSYAQDAFSKKILDLPNKAGGAR